MAPSTESAHALLAPFRIQPRFDTRVWGFPDLRPWFDVTATGEPIGEAWLTGDDCLIATGPHAGKELGALFREMPERLLGKGAPDTASPLLIKVLFPAAKLSVQVHPDDAMAQRLGQPRGKTECWYALKADPDAEVAVGLKKGVTLDQVREQIHAGTLEASLNLIPVAEHDMIFVDAGTVHAIWPGAVILETQQNCDITYRMYDYGRPRELHVERSLEATKLVTRAGKVQPVKLADRTVLIDVDYFLVESIQVTGSRSSRNRIDGSGTESSLAYLFAASGAARITGDGFEPVDLGPRGIAAIPAESPDFAVHDLGGLELIRITPKWPQAGGVR